MLVKTQGITLKATPFQDRSKILQILTKDFGLISVIIKNLSKKNLNLLSISSLFTVSELVLKKAKSDIFTFRDGSLIEANMHLRKDLKFINGASFMTKAILSTNVHHKKESHYFLLKSYLKNISINPDAIFLSFLLKILSSEDFLHLKTQCNICENLAESIQQGESLCLKHSNDFAIKFSLEDFKKMFVLCFSKSFSLLEKIDISQNLKEKINSLFQELI
ncbi:MAG: DNA repair protein RecO [Candidatus Anoxychlamydiales bacterium]|nr:DNA repair protein RecO [Candidatus Anoxychlamydiales bacterium]